MTLLFLQTKADTPWFRAHLPPCRPFRQIIEPQKSDRAIPAGRQAESGHTASKKNRACRFLIISLIKIILNFFCEKIWPFQKKVVTLHSQTGNNSAPPASHSDRGAIKQNNGAVVQPVRIQACHAWGRGFESRPHRRGERKEQYGKLRFPIALFSIYKPPGL